MKMLAINRLAAACRRLAASRPPDFVIGADYLHRWYVIPRNRFFNIYLHRIMHDDDDRALHDHPWVNCSIILWGGYVEHRPDGGSKFRWAGDIVFRWPRSAHRLSLVRHVSSIQTLRRQTLSKPRECWSLFITAPRVRTWGFYCPQGWVPWHEFVAPSDSGQVGRGCGE